MHNVKGFAGVLLRVNLTTRECRKTLLPEESVLRKYLGGIGLGRPPLCQGAPDQTDSIRTPCPRTLRRDLLRSAAARVQRAPG